jgi:hypothetical protein
VVAESPNTTQAHWYNSPLISGSGTIDGDHHEGRESLKLGELLDRHSFCRRTHKFASTKSRHQLKTTGIILYPVPDPNM